MKFTAKLNGTVNGELIKLTGHGKINNGNTDGKYKISCRPQDFDTSLLSIALVTGYPNASQAICNSFNIFKGNSYSYKRKISFMNGDELDLNADCKLNNDNLYSTFELNGNAIFNNLISIEPMIESWIPFGKGKIKGHFTASWKNNKGEVVSADVNSIYNIETDSRQQEVLHRFITMDSISEGNTVRKIQDVILFNKLPSFSKQNNLL